MYETVETDETNAPILAILMIATSILTVLTILATIALFYWKSEQVSNQYADENPGIGRIMVEQQTHELNQYRWVDKEAGKVTLPIEAAQELLIKEGI